MFQQLDIDILENKVLLIRQYFYQNVLVLYYIEPILFKLPFLILPVHSTIRFYQIAFPSILVKFDLKMKHELLIQELVHIEVQHKLEIMDVLVKVIDIKCTQILYFGLFVYFCLTLLLVELLVLDLVDIKYESSSFQIHILLLQTLTLLHNHISISNVEINVLNYVF